MKQTGLLLMMVVFLAGCEKSISIQTDQQDPKLVVEAVIESGQQPVVILSSSLDYFSTIDAATLNGTYVHNAKVTITTGTKSYVLVENSLPLGNGYFYYYYTTNTFSNPLLGDFGKTYDLEIKTGGKTYNATTTIPLLTKKIDSIWWKKAPDNPDTTKAVVMVRVTDPPGFGNYIRYFTKVNSEQYYPARNSVYDDQIIDGKTYDVQVDKGYSRDQKPGRDEYGYFKRGDTVVMKHCNIDKATYDFWRTWEFSYQSVGNPFSTPGKVLGNISNGALGCFSGYASQFKTLIIPK